MSILRGVVVAALVVAALAGGPLQAQEEVAFDRQEMIPGPWKFDNFPYFTVTPNDGFLLIGRAQYGQAADFLDRVSMARRFAIEGGASPSGSRYLALKVDMPRLAKGWRLAADFRLDRANHFGAFVRGSDDALDLGPDAPYTRARRVRSSAWAEITRTVAGRLSLAVSGGVAAIDWTRLPPGSALALQASPYEETDATVRVAAVLDLRDREFEPQKGVLAEAGIYRGSFGAGYHGGYGIVSGFINPRFGTVIAARVGGRSVTVDAPLDARYSIPAWERPLSGLGGPQTHRALDLNRYGGRGVVFGSLEIRQVMIDGGDMLGIYGLAFVDAGRAFADEGFRLTTKDLTVGGGLGLAIRILRANVFNVTAARGPDGTKVMVGSGWAF